MTARSWCWMIGLCVLLLGQSVSLSVHAETTAGQESTTSSVVSPARLEAQLRRHVLEHLEQRDAVLTVHVLRPRKPVQISHAPYTLQVRANPLGVRTGRQAFRVDVLSGNRRIQTIPVVAEVKAEMEVVIPVRWIGARRLLSETDLTVTRMVLPTLHHEYVHTLREAVGKKTVRPLAPHRPIPWASLSLPPVIRKGDRVIIQAKRSGLLVQAVGIAEGSGKPGETIPVRNQTSGREVLGTIVEAGLVEVSF